MRLMCKGWIAAPTFALALTAGAASAGTADGKFAVEDAGRTTCAAYERARAAHSESYGRYIGFVEGYVTAANRYEANTFDLTPWHNPQAFALILNRHCKDHPQDTLVMSVQRLVVAMKPLRLTGYSPMVRVNNAGRRVEVYQATLQQAQHRLKTRGLYAGPEDGRFSPEVKAGLERFQRSVKLDPTGVPDPATLWVLLNP